MSDSVKNKPALQVIPQWYKIFFTWSFWFHSLAVVLTFVDQILPFFSLLEPTMTVQTYAICVFTLNALGIVSRFIKQRKLWDYQLEKTDENIPNDS